MANTTNITLETFKTITSSDGTFSTWTDIIETARQALPLNNEILGAPFKSMQEVIGDNIEFKNATTKFVEYFRDDLQHNNKLELDKMVMFLKDDYMTSLEYSSLDMKSAQEWASLVSDSINQMFITKKDVDNYLAVDEIQKIALALGNFTIVPKAKDLITDARGNIHFDAFKSVGIKMRRLLNTYRTKRTKYAKGIDINRLKWVNDYDFSLNLLASLTAGFSASNNAYEDIKSKNTTQMFLGTPFTQSMYLGNNLDMGEFQYQNQQGQTQTANAGIHTGNVVKPFTAEHLFSISWLPESLQYYGHNFKQSDVPKTNSRTERVISFIWRAQVGILPILAGFNHIFITKLPVFPSYIKRDGSVVAEMDLSKHADFIKFNQEIRNSQPMLYNTLIDATGKTGTWLNDQASLTKYITDNTLDWVGTRKATFVEKLKGAK